MIINIIKEYQEIATVLGNLVQTIREQLTIIQTAMHNQPSILKDLQVQ